MENEVVIVVSTIDALAQLMGKYEDLVWYARSHPESDQDYWAKSDPSVMAGSLRTQERIEKTYPQEVARICGELPDFVKAGVDPSEYITVSVNL